MTRTLVLGMFATLMLALVPLALGDDNATTTTAPAPHTDCPPDATDCDSHKAPGGVKSDDSAGTCMDGQQENESCDPNVMYFGGGPADSGPTNATHGPGDEDVRATGAESASAAAGKSVPGLALAGVAVAAAIAIALVGRKS